jgi:poly(3-hydroxybutyrate) depolymerase
MTMSRARFALNVPIRSLVLCIAALALLGAAPANAQVAPRGAAAAARAGFQLREFKDDAGSHKYSLFIPAGYTPARKWPVILFLHGAGERGTDGILPTGVGLGPLVKVREANFPFLVVFPQNEETHGRILTGWSPESADGKRALAILSQVEKDFSVDTKREILTGWSMGGYGAWQLAAATADRWLAVVPVSSGGDPALAEKLKGLPIWAFHGAKDKVVRPEESRTLIEAIKNAGGQPRYTELAEGDHNVWTQVYDDDRLYAWMLSPRSDPASLRPVTSRPPTAPGQAAKLIPEAPFVPALDVPRALYVRMGNEMLAALADSIPQVVPRDSLMGRLNDISDYTEAEGYGFSVYMSGISYYGQLVRAHVKAYQKDRLNIQLGLSNVQVTIGGTSVTGERHSASAGPISVVIGHQRPVWLSFDVTPFIAERKLRLKLVATGFNIPNDNWYVSGPAGVSVSGFGLTRDKVANGLVSGIYGKKYTIEREVAAVVPKLIAQMEEKLDIAQFNQAAVGSVWPLPVYQPRLRVWPAEVSTDDKGISLVLGVTAAAVDPAKAPRQVRVSPPAGPGAAEVPQVTTLQVGISPKALVPLSEMLIQADVARIHVADTPSRSLARLADPAVLAEAIPDLKRYGDRLQVYSELVLAGPINIVDLPPGAHSTGEAATEAAAENTTGEAGSGTVEIRPTAAVTSGDAHRRFAFDVPQIKVLVSIKRDPSATAWTPCAELDLSLRQGAHPQLTKPTSLTRAVAISWDDKAQIEAKARFVEGYPAEETSIDVAKLKSLFDAGWEEYIHGGPPAQLELPDINLGYTKLRANDAGWAPPSLFATFGPPGVKLTNSSEAPLVYETKGPYSGWGGPYTLAPGGTHEFPIAYPMVFRRRLGGGYQSFTLPAGSHSEFRLVTGQAMLYQAREPDEIEKANVKPPKKEDAEKTDEKESEAGKTAADSKE